MLTLDQLVQLHDRVRERAVLSVYIDAREENPAEKREWRLRLRNMLRATEEGSDPEQLSALREAVAHVEDNLRPYPGLLPGPGWVAFAAPDQLLYVGPVPAPVPDLVRWDTGIHVAPYVRALKQARPVDVVIIDQLRARILEYRFGKLEERAGSHSDPSSHRGDFGSSKRASTSSGIRGEARTDAAQRQMEASTERLVRDVVETLAHHQATEHTDANLLVLGGNAEVVAALLERLPDARPARAIETAALRIDSPEAEVRQVVEAAVSTLSSGLQADLVEAVIEAARSGGRGSLGPEPVERALQSGAVDTLLMSRGLARTDPALAHRLFLAALDQSANTEEVGGGPGDLLDGVGGVAARLRFSA